jgi:hypothetical protein
MRRGGRVKSAARWLRRSPDAEEGGIRRTVWLEIVERKLLVDSVEWNRLSGIC